MAALNTPLPFRKKAALQLLALCIVLPLCALGARPFLGAVEWQLIQSGMGQISAQHWLGAVLASALSFAALGQYDVIIQRVLGLSVPQRAVLASGAAAVALSQTLGFGLITGTIARWRALPTLSLARAGSVTALVSLSFMGAWLALFGLAGLAAPEALALPRVVFAACLFSAFCFALYTALKRYIAISGRRVRLPSLKAIGAMLAFAALDTGCAALALWLLMPEGVQIAMMPLYAIYLACLGAALISNAPGGVGPFELTLLWSLQSANVNDVLVGLLAFRVIYFALPACAAALYLLRPAAYAVPRKLPFRIAGARHPETASALQTGEMLCTSGSREIGALGRSTQTAALLFDPPCAFSDSAQALRDAARARCQIPLHYKLGARTAVQARRSGHAVLRIAQDAVIDLRAADLAIPARRSLRRKLKAAARAGLVLAPFTLDAKTLKAATRIDRDWQAATGRARGFSMGRFCPAYMNEQHLFGAYKDGELIAFITINAAQGIWALDIMRSSADCPGGTMHALVWHAVMAAQAAGCTTFSLASTPSTQAPLLRLIDRCSLSQDTQANGLKQFKRSFAPRWVPLYAAAPSWPALCIALWDVWQEVQDPVPLNTT